MVAPQSPRDDDLDRVTHQMLNRLTTVKGHAQLLHRSVGRPVPTHPDVVRANLGRIIDAADRIVELVVEMRDWRPQPPRDEH